MEQERVSLNFHMPGEKGDIIKMILQIMLGKQKIMWETYQMVVVESFLTWRSMIHSYQICGTQVIWYAIRQILYYYFKFFYKVNPICNTRYS